MAVQRIQPDGLSKPPTYSQVVKAGNTVYLAGQVAQDENGQVVGPGDFVAQANQVFENLAKGLEAAGAGFGDLVKITTYLTDVRYRMDFRVVRDEFFGQRGPASTMVEVSSLSHPDYLIEVEAIAVV